MPPFLPSLPRRVAEVIILVMKFRLRVEFDPEAKRWSAVFPELPGCATAGDSEAEAIANAQEALALWFEHAPIKLPKGAKMIELAAP
jgi:predicted RNase H-like HicB family nuclease